MSLFSGIDRAAPNGVKTRSISPENPDGAPGGGGRAVTGTGAHYARDLGPGWKMNPFVLLAPGVETVIADVEGPGRIVHLWMTTEHIHWRSIILRFYWDDDPEPAVEVPYGDFFCNGWGRFAAVTSAMITALPNGGFTSYWPMPFTRRARVTVENLGDTEPPFFFQIDVELGEVADDALRFHAQWRRDNPLMAGENHRILEGVEGRGHFVGCYTAWGNNSRGWWGEGELKAFLDDDGEFPTICGTGTEDYFAGAWNFDVNGNYVEFSTLFAGMPQVIRPDGLYESQQRFGMYRWQVPDPIRFEKRIRVEIQALGWRDGRRYLPLHDDIASMAVFYLDRTSAARPERPSLSALETL